PAVRARAARPRAQRPGLRRVDLLGGAHPRDARMREQQLAAGNDAVDNRADLQRHAYDFRNRTGFTYTVLDPASRDVIGCVYIYPLPDSGDDARALSWVRAGHADVDVPPWRPRRAARPRPPPWVGGGHGEVDVRLWRAVSDWLASDWPFGSVEYAPRA